MTLSFAAGAAGHSEPNIGAPGIQAFHNVIGAVTQVIGDALTLENSGSVPEWGEPWKQTS